MNLVDAQQARRVLDRMVGYPHQPAVMGEGKTGAFSAGRVQSAALRIICDREDEISGVYSGGILEPGGRCSLRG